MKKIALPLIVAAVLFARAGYAGADTSHEVKVSAEVSHTGIPLNKHITLTIRVTWMSGGDTVNITEVSDPVLTNFTITGTAAANRAEAVSGSYRQVRETEYTLKPQGLGMGYVEPVSVVYTVSSRPDPVRVETRRFGVTITDAVAEPGAHAFPWMPVFAGIAAAAAGLLIISRRTARKNDQPEPDPGINEEEALALIRKIMTAHKGNPTDIITSLLSMFRRYLNKEFGITAPEATSDQLIAGLEQAGAETSFLHKLSDVFEQAHTVTFSGGKALPADADTACSVIEDFLQKRLAEKKNTDCTAHEQARGIAGLFSRNKHEGNSEAE